MKRDRFMCTYCGKPGTDVELEIDHIIPRSMGGSNHMSNLTTACRNCNQSKSNKLVRPSMKPQSSKGASTEGLIGLYLHVLRDGEITKQGYITRVFRDHAIVMFSSFWDGQPVKSEPVLIADILDAEKTSLYETSNQMSRAFWEEQKRNGSMEGSVDEQLRMEAAFRTAMNQ